MFKSLDFILILLGFLLFCLFALYTFKRLGRGWSLKILFKDFNRKMWMTLCLGGLFFGLYLFAILLGRYLIREWGTDFFFLVYHYPIKFVYGGLWLFACLSLSIYLARMVIKYFYLTRGKDN